MKAIILAAGKSTRLLPLTKETPLCMLKVNGRTILERQIYNLKASGIKEITVITGYFSEKLGPFCEQIGVQSIFNPFYAVSGMASTLWMAKEKLKDGFLFLYSDILFDQKIIDGLLQNKGDICLAVKKNELREEAEKIIEEGGIIERLSKTVSDEENGEFVGLAKFSGQGAAKLMNELDRTLRIDLTPTFIDVINGLIRKGEKVDAYDIKEARFIDIDFPEDLKRAEIYFLE